METRANTKYNRAVKFSKLNNLLQLNNISIKELSESIGISDVSLYNKIKGKQNFKLNEMLKIQKEVNKKSKEYYTMDFLFGDDEWL